MPKRDGHIERPAFDFAAANLLFTDPDRYFEERELAHVPPTASGADTPNRD